MEGWVLTLPRTYAQKNELYDSIFYCAPSQSRGREVDFLLVRGGEMLALAVKSGRRFSRSWLRGLNTTGSCLMS